MQQLKKREKSCFFDFEQKKTLKRRGHLITPVFNTQLPKVSTGRPQWRQREFKVGGDEPREPTVRLPD